VNGQNVVKVGHRQVVNMIRQGGNSLVVKVVMVTRHPEAPEGPRRRAAPPQPRRLPAPAISLRSKSMTSELEEMEYDPSSATEKKRTVYQMALNKLDEILAAAQQSISAGEGPGPPLPPLGKTRPKGFFSPEAPFEAHRMGPGGFDRPFLPPGPPHGLMLRQKSIGAPEEDKPFLAPPSGKFSRSLSVPGSDDIPPPPTTSPPEPPYSTPPAPLGAATPRTGPGGGPWRLYNFGGRGSAGGVGGGTAPPAGGDKSSISIPTIVVKAPSTSSSGRSSRGSSVEAEGGGGGPGDVPPPSVGGVGSSSPPHPPPPPPPPPSSSSTPFDFTSQFGAALVGAARREWGGDARRRSALFLSTEEEEDAAGGILAAPPRLRHSKSIDEGMFVAGEVFPTRPYRAGKGAGAGSAFSSVAAPAATPGHASVATPGHASAATPSHAVSAPGARGAASTRGAASSATPAACKSLAAALQPALQPAALQPGLAPLPAGLSALPAGLAALTPTGLATLRQPLQPGTGVLPAALTVLQPGGGGGDGDAGFTRRGRRGEAGFGALPSRLGHPRYNPPVRLYRKPNPPPPGARDEAAAPRHLPKLGAPPPTAVSPSSSPSEARLELRVRFAEAGGLLALPPPAPSVDGDEELLLAEPLPPPLEFANSFEGPEGPPVGDSTASSLTSYDSEVATLTQGTPENRRGAGGPATATGGAAGLGIGGGVPEGADVVTDSGIEEVDSRSSSDHPPESGEGPPPYAPLGDGGERVRSRGRGARGGGGGEGRRAEIWEDAGRGGGGGGIGGIGGIAAAWPRAAGEGPFGAPGRHRLPDPAGPPPPSAKPPPSSATASASSSTSLALFPNWPPPKSSPSSGGIPDLDVRPPLLRRAPSPATLPTERRGSPAPRPASLPTLPAGSAPLYAGFFEFRGAPGVFGEIPPARSLSPTRPPPPPPDKPFGAKPLAFWSKFDVADWLEYLNLGEHRARFLHNEIDGSHLPSLTKEDYIDLGVTRVGHRMNIDRALKLFLER
ncbi:LOW QUALITY PROTEIN: SH3 and multiple ankyrin repeat domains protein 1-like, partial [Accipiter gentilis]|uniref:LOW QUALITY PROTEIN: SH3 and multiple ankyrin repeat domains protein 1-like n=1 Tax=Astur gentilis TaxID=8957 RepID=UPI0021101CC8